MSKSAAKSEETEAEKEQYLTLLKTLNAELIEGDHYQGLRIAGWKIQSKKRPILDSDAREEWMKKLKVAQLPEMVFGDSSLELVHEELGIKIHFNAFDALQEWKKEALPPVEIPAAAKWKFRSKPSQEVVLDYDYTFTTRYSGSEVVDQKQEPREGDQNCWKECEEQIDLVALQSKDPILFYDEVVLYEDELADNGVSLLTVKVRVMPTCWFLLLRFWLRVDGVLMRMRDTRMFCSFGKDDSRGIPTILRDRCGREETLKILALKGFPSYSSSYNDPSFICDKLPIIWHYNEMLSV